MAAITISVQEDDFDVTSELDALKDDKTGAIASFIGTVRDSDGHLKSLTLEHYPEMTERQITRIAEQACQKWPLSAVRIIHRIGRLLPQDNIVLVAAASAHREAALDAVHFMMDYLKTDAPFWKSEETEKGINWVSAHSKDDDAKDKWQ